MSALGVDTRSDIYSLGVLLYELLTGSTPLSHKRVKEAGYAEILRMIKEEEPPRPSTRLSDSGETLASISAQRHMEPAKLTKLVRGELDWIVMKALEKDRNRRYETASAFAADAQRYLNDESVQACPPSAWYRFRKFARRNRRTLATSAVLGLLLLLACGAVAGSAGWAMRDREARRVAVAARFDQVLQESERLYQEGRLPEATAAAKRAQELLNADDGGEELQRRLREWLADLDMVARLEAARLRWGDFIRGRPNYAEVFRDYGIDLDALPAPEAAARIAARPIRVDLAVALDAWAWRSHDPGLGQRLREIAVTADPDPVRNRIRAVTARPDQAALRSLAETLDVGSVHLAILNMLGQRLWDSGDQAAAIAFLRRAQQQYPGDFGINLALGDMFFAATPRSLDDALRQYTAAIAVRPDSAIAYYRLGRTLFLLRRLDESVAAHRRLIALDPQYPTAHRKLSYLLSMRGQLDEAIAVCRASASLPAQDGEWLAELLNRRARQLCSHADPGARDPSRAVDLAGEAVTWQPTNGAYWETRGMACYRAGRWQEAAKALEKWGELQPPGAGAGTFFLAMALWQLGNKEEARKRYDQAAQWADRNQSQNGDLRRLQTEAEELLGLKKPQ
jgi:tetratricopeptide (TPR) repeat protein